jgi:hypothetical protein
MSLPKKLKKVFIKIYLNRGEREIVFQVSKTRYDKQANKE